MKRLAEDLMRDDVIFYKGCTLRVDMVVEKYSGRVEVWTNSDEHPCVSFRGDELVEVKNDNK